MSLTLDNLKLAVRGAIKSNATYFGVLIYNEFNEQEELIINTTKNMIEGKLNYYLTAYNDDLTLKTQSKIIIRGFSFANNVEEIRKDLSY